MMTEYNSHAFYAFRSEAALSEILEAFIPIAQKAVKKQKYPKNLNINLFLTEEFVQSNTAQKDKSLLSMLKFSQEWEQNYFIHGTYNGPVSKEYKIIKDDIIYPPTHLNDRIIFSKQYKNFPGLNVLKTLIDIGHEIPYEMCPRGEIWNPSRIYGLNIGKQIGHIRIPTGFI